MVVASMKDIHTETQNIYTYTYTHEQTPIAHLAVLEHASEGHLQQGNSHALALVDSNSVGQH